MAYPPKADWHSVDWSLSNRDIAGRLGVDSRAVGKRRAKLGHASDYKVDAVLLRSWFESNRKRMPRMTDEDIQVEVFDAVEIMLEKSQVYYWRKLMNPRIWAQKARQRAMGTATSLTACCVLLCVAGWLLLAGCTVSGKDNGQIVLTFGTSLSLGTVTATTGAEPSATLTVDDRIVEKLTAKEDPGEDE